MSRGLSTVAAMKTTSGRGYGRALAGLLVMAALIVAGCASAPERRDREFWGEPDGPEFFISYRDKGLGLYLNSNAARLCYGYIIPGRWTGTKESALLRAEDSESYAGVLLYPANELADFDGPDIARRAAGLTTRIYEKAAGRPLAKVDVQPFDVSGRTKWTDSERVNLLDALLKETALLQPKRHGAIRWSASWPIGKGRQAQASKVFVEISDGWVAQITASPDDDDLIRSIIETLSISSPPECYRPFIRKNFPHVR